MTEEMERPRSGLSVASSIATTTSTSQGSRVRELLSLTRISECIALFMYAVFRKILNHVFFMYVKHIQVSKVIL